MRLFPIAIALTIIYFSGSYFLPTHFFVQKKTTVSALPHVVFPYFEDLKKWKQWALWASRDTELVYNFSDKFVGNGAWMTWDSHSEGHGEVRILDEVFNYSIKYKMLSQQNTVESICSLELEPKEEATEIVWSCDLQVEKNLMMRWIGRIYKQWLANDLAANLWNLKLIFNK